MLAGNSLNSFLNSKSEENSTLGNWHILNIDWTKNKFYFKVGFFYNYKHAFLYTYIEYRYMLSLYCVW